MTQSKFQEMKGYVSYDWLRDRLEKDEWEIESSYHAAQEIVDSWAEKKFKRKKAKKGKPKGKASVCIEFADIDSFSIRIKGDPLLYKGGAKVMDLVDEIMYRATHVVWKKETE